MPDYSTYDVEALVEDPGFIAWVRNPDQKQEAFWRSFLSDHPERAAVVSQARHIVALVETKQEKLAEDRVQALWRKIEAGMGGVAEEGKRIQIKPRNRVWVQWSVAAALVLLLVVSYLLLRPQTISIRSGNKEILTQVLPDQSAIYLNAGSEIRYSKNDFGKKLRKVNLKGEAFFDVKKKEPPFLVETSTGTIKVLGTSFNVFTRDEKLIVKCHSGTVLVDIESDRDTLTKGEVAMVVNGGFGLYVGDKVGEKDWRSGSFPYTNAPFGEVLAELERQFDVIILADKDMKERTYTGSFSNKAPLESALKLVCWPLSIEYRIEDNRIILSEKVGP